MTKTGAQTTRFPDGFVWGAATSAYQIEGATAEDGRGASIWDAFARTPGKIDDGTTGDMAIDHYHRYRDDVRLLKAIGAMAYRFSVAWPRVFPDGTGAPNSKGLAFYDRLVDELLASGIEPYTTLYHWDLPQALQERVGGWLSRETPLAFADYAGYMAEKLSDRVKHFFTINEFYSFVEFGYGSGINAPGLKLPPDRLNQVRHHAVLGHGLATQAIRARAKPGTRVGPVDNITVAVPAIETADHIRAAEVATRDLNAPYLTVILEGRYTDAYLAAAGTAAPRFTEQELRAIATPVDYVGINVYMPSHYVLAGDTTPGYRLVPFNKSHPRMAAPWHLLGPEALYWGPRHVARLWAVNEVYITENGCAADDHVAADGNVYDTDRVMFLRNYLTQLQRATADGVPVGGYFLWSPFDNFEWANGYSLRFGLIHVDYATQKRRPKLSAAFYQEVIARNAVA
ncbi:MAG TPA: GH1 family beta-glucosidase [Gemmataceae bacterium]|nr:GH1 family beta-glucosidase [Gemmataceae bacterium]